MRQMNAMKWLVLCCLLAMTVLAGCSGGDANNGPAAPNNSGTGGGSGTNSSGDGGNNPDAPKDPVTLRMSMWDSNNDFIEFLTNKVKEFSEIMPHVTVEVESFKDDGGYLQAMKVRAGGGALPDIIELKPNWLSDFKEQLLPLDDLDSVLSRNEFADKYTVDGAVLAVPTVSFPELVYYHPEIFESLNLEVPTNWPAFIETLQAIKDDGTYIPYAMGGKDAWPNYPFNEFLPHIISGNEHFLSDLAKEDAPFGEGTPFYEGFSRIADLYAANVMGPDPLGIGFDQASSLFISKQAAVIALGLWFAPSYEAATGSTDDLAAFPMPYRMSDNEELKLMMFTDHFYGINNATKHADEAKAFLEWFYSPDVYREYINAAQLGSTFSDVEGDNPFLKRFLDTYDIPSFTYIPGDVAYTELSNAIQLDVKALGQEMMAGRSVDDITADLNEKWKRARGSQ